MKIDIWSDIMCPFCYIGKRKMEHALEQFEHKNNVELIWHSFQLDPAIKHEPGRSVYEYLAEHKGISRERALQMHAHVTRMADEAGLTYNFDKAVIANSFDAHQLIQMAKVHGLGDAAEERLFRAYFTEGENVGDRDTLVRHGGEIGLDQREVRTALENNVYADAVRRDIARAQELGIRGVPFFILHNRYAVSGAQPVEVFLDGLRQAWAEYEKEQPTLVDMSAEGGTCSVDGVCEPTDNNTTTS